MPVSPPANAMVVLKLHPTLKQVSLRRRFAELLLLLMNLNWNKYSYSVSTFESFVHGGISW